MRNDPKIIKVLSKIYRLEAPEEEGWEKRGEGKRGKKEGERRRERKKGVRERKRNSGEVREK